jgi:hypothetical protein
VGGDSLSLPCPVPSCHITSTYTGPGCTSLLCILHKTRRTVRCARRVSLSALPFDDARWAWWAAYDLHYRLAKACISLSHAPADLSKELTSDIIFLSLPFTFPSSQPWLSCKYKIGSCVISSGHHQRKSRGRLLCCLL